MFVTVSTYRARAGEEDAIVALHEDWQRTRRATAAGFVAGQLLRSRSDPRSFIDVARFDSEESARRMAGDPEQGAWYRRLASLCDVAPLSADYQVEWQVDPA